MKPAIDFESFLSAQERFLSEHGIAIESVHDIDDIAFLLAKKPEALNELARAILADSMLNAEEKKDRAKIAEKILTLAKESGGGGTNIQINVAADMSRIP